MSHSEAVIPHESAPWRVVGRCIWCGRGPPEATLGDEHMIPFSFGGHRTLADACCLDCQEDQSAYIGHCCDKMLRAMRLHHGLPSRKKSKKTVSVAIGEGGPPIPVEVSHDNAPGAIFLPVLDFPSLLNGATRLENEVAMTGFYASSTTDDAEQREKALEASGVASGGALSQIPVTPFVRVLAHIGHAFLAAQGWDEESLLLHIAKGDLRNSHKYVGGMPPHVSVPEPGGDGIHQILLYNVRGFDGSEYVMANIRMFTHLRPLPPVYSVLLCRRKITHGDQYVSFERDEATNSVNVNQLVMLR